MIRLKDFKKIADQEMSEINVTELLKKKTLARCRRNSYVPISKFLIPAACLVFILSIASLNGVFNLNRDKNPTNGLDTTIMLASPNSIQEGTLEGKELKTIEEARKAFGNELLIPSSIPEGFALGGIQALGEEKRLANIISMQYSSDDKQFLVVAEKTEVQMEFLNFKAISINGTTGFIKSSTDTSTVESSSVTELYWFNKGAMYCIKGSITEQEAITIAMSMK